jgi:hypothetical protein
MTDASRTTRRRLLQAVFCGLLGSLAGCGPVATLAWLIHGPEMIPAEFDGLKGKRVAVVCLDANSLTGPGGEADTVAKAVGFYSVKTSPIFAWSGKRKWPIGSTATVTTSPITATWGAA